MSYVFLKFRDDPLNAHLYLDLEDDVDVLFLLNTYFNVCDPFTVSYKNPDNPLLEQLISVSIKDLIFVLVARKSPKIAKKLGKLSAEICETLIHHKYDAYEELIQKRLKLYNNKIKPLFCKSENV